MLAAREVKWLATARDVIDIPFDKPPPAWPAPNVVAL
jgi:hypothetical protein